MTWNQSARACLERTVSFAAAKLTRSIAALIVSVTALLIGHAPIIAEPVVVRSVVNPSNGHEYHLIYGDGTPTDGAAGLGVSWTEAEQFAVDRLGGHLVAINDAAESEFLQESFADRPGPKMNIYVWIGLTDQHEEGVFEWSNGEPVDYTNWYPGEPNALADGEDYAHLYNFAAGRFQWNDRRHVADWGDDFPMAAIAEVTPAQKVDRSALQTPEQLRFAYVYLSDADSAASFQELLEDNGFGADLLPLDELPTTDLTPYDAVIVGSDIERAWNESHARLLRDAKKPVLGLGEGGYYLFGRLMLPIGDPNGWHGAEVSIKPRDPSESAFWSSFDLQDSEREELILYSKSEQVGIYLREEESGMLLLGQELGSQYHYPLVEQDHRYLLWGFTASPEQMTPLGKRLFLHTCRYLAERRDNRQHQPVGSPRGDSATMAERLQQLEERVTRIESRRGIEFTPDAATGDNRTLGGEWENVDEKDRGLLKLSIRSRADGQWSIRAWGSCHPTPCAWRATRLHLFGDNVASTDFHYGLAKWEPDFGVRHMILRLEENELVTETYTVFTDASQRSNYRSMTRFRREETIPAAPSAPCDLREQQDNEAAVQRLAPTPLAATGDKLQQQLVRPLGGEHPFAGDPQLAVYVASGGVSQPSTLLQVNWKGEVLNSMEVPFSISGLAPDRGRLVATVGSYRVGEGRVMAVSPDGSTTTVFQDPTILPDTIEIWSSAESREIL